LFKVIGMYCTTCKPIVEKQPTGEQAVKKIDIDFMTDSIIVEYDPALITKSEIKKRLENSGIVFKESLCDFCDLFLPLLLCVCFFLLWVHCGKPRPVPSQQ
jgi:copper chaperone